MSTSAIISIRTYCEATQEYVCKSAYLSHDGHIAGRHAAGELLLKHYNTAELAQGLIDLGGMRAIGETADKCERISNVQAVENAGKYPITPYAHIEFKYIFDTDMSCWVTEYEFPMEHKAEFISLDYIVRYIKKQFGSY